MSSLMTPQEEKDFRVKWMKRQYQKLKNLRLVYLALALLYGVLLIPKGVAVLQEFSALNFLSFIFPFTLFSVWTFTVVRLFKEVKEMKDRMVLEAI